MTDFVSEDDLNTFEGWLKYQRGGGADMSPDERAMWREMYDDIKRAPTVGLMDLKQVTGEHRYAVAVREGNDLWLTLWVRRSPKGDVYVLVPRGDRDWNPHTSYHRDGTFHSKSFNAKLGQPAKRQPLNDAFRGAEHLGGFKGHGPKAVGAACDPNAFSGVVEVSPGILGPGDGAVVVDLVEPGHEPTVPVVGDVVSHEVFRDVSPWLVIRVIR